MRHRDIMSFACILLASSLLGCAAIPDIRSQPQIHNPFPQLQRVAVLPFANQSQEPTLDTDRVTIAYHNELQKLPGFEVKPVGVVQTQMKAMGIEIDEATDLQALAQHLNVDVVVLGAVTEYTPYYPPRLGMRVHWYAANPGFHPIPAGYGLPWGTAEEEYIPDKLVHEAEFALAREQLKTQTPDYVKAPLPKRPLPQVLNPDPLSPPSPAESDPESSEEIPPGMEPSTTDNALQVSQRQAGGPAQLGPVQQGPVQQGPVQQGQPTAAGLDAPWGPSEPGGSPPAQELPPDWPDPIGFLPEGPGPTRPPLIAQAEPIITHTRLYDGNDENFTQQVSEYFYFKDDARFGGWQAYLQRSEDFIRVCCYLHVTETLAARGGAGKSRVVWRWPIDRYER